MDAELNLQTRTRSQDEHPALPPWSTGGTVPVSRTRRDARVVLGHSRYPSKSFTSRPRKIKEV